MMNELQFVMCSLLLLSEGSRKANLEFECEDAIADDDSRLNIYTIVPR